MGGVDRSWGLSGTGETIDAFVHGLRRKTLTTTTFVLQLLKKPAKNGFDILSLSVVR